MEEEMEEELGLELGVSPSPSRIGSAHSCSSLLRLEQEAKRKKRAQQQRKAADIMPGERR